MDRTCGEGKEDGGHRTETKGEGADDDYIVFQSQGATSRARLGVGSGVDTGCYDPWKEQEGPAPSCFRNTRTHTFFRLRAASLG